MTAFLNPAPLPIIGHFPAPASPLLQNLADLRAPNFPLLKTTWELTWADLPNQNWKIQRPDLLAINDQPAKTLTP